MRVVLLRNFLDVSSVHLSVQGSGFRVQALGFMVQG